MNCKKLYVIVGPTAVGKTALSIELAERIDAEIVSADAIQVYERLDIGSAKPTLLERRGVVHHMLSVVPVDCPDYSVAAYKDAAMACVEGILARGKVPLVVGGTGLYVDALTKSMDFAEAADHALRDELLKHEQSQSGSLHKRLMEIDPAAARRIHPNDIKRIIRALEVQRLTGKSISEHIEASRKLPPPYASRILGLNMDRPQLYRRIESRVMEMMRLGLLDEARALYEAGLSRHLRSMQGLGYKQLFSYFSGECTLEEAVEAIKCETRRFAKRQLTWLRRDERIYWLDADGATLPQLADAAEQYFKNGAV